MTDVLNILKERFADTVKDANIWDAFVFNKELYIASEYDFDHETFNNMEEFVLLNF